MKSRVADLTRFRYVIHTLDWIFERPVFRSTDFATGTGIFGRTARRILDVLCEGGVLRIIVPGSGRRTSIFVFLDLMNIAEGRKVF